MIVSTAIDSAHLAFYAQSFDMCPLLFIVDESFVLVMIPKNDASLSLVSNLDTSQIYDERRDAR